MMMPDEIDGLRRAPCCGDQARTLLRVPVQSYQARPAGGCGHGRDSLQPTIRQPASEDVKHTVPQVDRVRALAHIVEQGRNHQVRRNDAISRQRLTGAQAMGPVGRRHLPEEMGQTRRQVWRLSSSPPGRQSLPELPDAIAQPHRHYSQPARSKRNMTCWLTGPSAVVSIRRKTEINKRKIGSMSIDRILTRIRLPSKIRTNKSIGP